MSLPESPRRSRDSRCVALKESRDSRLLYKLLYEMAVDFMESDGHTLDPKEASKMERAEIERRLEPFVTQLSAGLEHIQRIFARP